MKAVNLIPAEQRERSAGFANRSEGVAYVVLGVFAGVALLALLYGVARHQVSSKEAEAVRYESEAQRVQAQASHLAPYKSFVAMREGREQAVRELVNSRFDWPHAVAEFGRVLPPGVSIANFEGCVVQVTPGSSETAGCSGGSSSSSAKSASSGGVSSATPAGSIPHFTLTGCATSQSTLARALTDMRLIDGVKEVELASSSKSSSTGAVSASSSSSGSCGPGDVSFSAKLTFEPLPTPPSGALPSASQNKQVPAASGAGATVSHGAAKSQPVGAAGSGGRSG